MRLILIVLLASMILHHAVPSPMAASSAYRGTDHTITVQLLTSLGEPIEDAIVYFYHEDHNILLGSSITNETGYATFLWQIPLIHELGIAHLNATFLGDPERYLLPCSVPITITIYAKMKVIVDVYDSNGNPIETSVYPDQTLVFNIIVKNDQLEPLEGIPVQLFTMNNQIVEEGETSENGTITFKYKLDSFLNSAIFFRVCSLSTAYYNGSELILNYIVENSSSQFVGLPSFVQKKDHCQISGLLQNHYGRGIPNAQIQILLDGILEIGEAITNQDGHFTFDLSQFQYDGNTGRFLIVIFQGQMGHQTASALIGLISNAAPFSQLVGNAISEALGIFLNQINLVALSCLSISSGFFARKYKRSTRNIVSH